jgi:nitroimidazol reductase NimA-like FMN-containing flavoprotein (pyridoxamine 5'-phosphate oxidase superfamily)
MDHSTGRDKGSSMQVRTMTALECTKFLESHRLGHLACSLDDKPYVVPIYYALRNNNLYSFSMPGKKVDIMQANPHVALLVEEFSEGRAWKSVMVEGRFEPLPDRVGSKVERDHAWSLLSKYANWWEPGSLKPIAPALADHSEHLFYRIVVEELSGREAVG